jgi:hypothetical protein
LAQHDLEDTTTPVRLLDTVRVETERLNRELACSKSEDEAALGRWIAEGGVGVRPQPSATTVAAIASLGELAPEVSAAAAILPTARAALGAAAERVRLAAAERDAALAAFATAELTEALNRALTVEAKILSLREALGSQTTGLAASERIAGAMRQAKAAAGVPRNSQAGRRLLDRLAHDPAATL